MYLNQSWNEQWLCAPLPQWQYGGCWWLEAFGELDTMTVSLGSLDVHLP